MSTKHLNRNARDSRISGSLAGLRKSRLETLEHHFLSQIKIIGKGLITPVLVYLLPNVPKYVFQVFQVSPFLTGGGFETGAINADGTLKVLWG